VSKQQIGNEEYLAGGERQCGAKIEIGICRACIDPQMPKGAHHGQGDQEEREDDKAVRHDYKE